MLKLFGLLFISLLPVESVLAQTYHIEDDYSEIPTPAEQCIKNSKEWESFKDDDSECELNGVEISLDESSKTKEYFVITKGTCGRGANSAPIWLIQLNRPNSGDCILFSESGFSLDIIESLRSKDSNRKYKEIKFGSNVGMGESVEVVYKYDGKAYVKK